MEELSQTKSKNIDSTCQEINGNGVGFLSKCGKSLQGLLKKVIVFICYGPGVLGFLWLIGRILKR